ncbi:hypothetical protein NKG05_11185 [Oerskovia sp. M15]
MRSAAIGVAAGCRSSLGLAAPLLTSSHTGPWAVVAKVGGALGIAAELAGTRAPGRGPGSNSPARRPAWPRGPRCAGAGAAGRGRRVRPGPPRCSRCCRRTWGGAAWRAAAVGRRPDWQAAVVEDAVALSLAAFATRS